MTGIEDLIAVIAQLRDPQKGCPWDLEQSHETLLPYFFEELYEFKEALLEAGPESPDTAEELGDVLYQIVLHAQLLDEKGYSNFDRIAAQTAEKMRLRHPHVFDPQYPRFKTGAEVTAAWEQIKAYARAKTKKGVATANSPAAPSANVAASASARVSSVPKALGALQRAGRVGEKASGFGFDWTSATEVLAKVDEELAELKVDFEKSDRAKSELGDLLFVLAQLARKRGWDAEDVLAQATEKFLRRFASMEQLATGEGKSFEKLSLADQESLWLRVKKDE